MGCVKCKKALVRALTDYFADFRAKRTELLTDKAILEGYLRDGAERARTRAVETMELVRDVRFMRRHLAGFGLRPVEGTPGTGTWHVGEVRIAND